jgi:predicted site-specific integrase-resolvase
VAKVVKEVESGVNDARPKLLALLEDESIGLIVVEHKDRLTRFGFRYLDTLLKERKAGLLKSSIKPRMGRKTCWPI